LQESAVPVGAVMGAWAREVMDGNLSVGRGFTNPAAVPGGRPGAASGWRQAGRDRGRRC
jgi:hypothetical protein